MPAKLKQTKDIEQVLDWAYRVQCVDRRAGGLRHPRPAAYPTATAFAAFEMLGTRVDMSSGVPPDLTNIKTDDALIIHDAVLRLSEMWIEWRGRDEVVVWDHASALAAGKLIEDTGHGFVLYDRESAGELYPVPLEQAVTTVLVIIHAKSGLRPDVHEDWVQKAGRPMSDEPLSYRRGKLRRTEQGVTAHAVMHARAVYMVWHAALSLLAIELDGVLDGFDIAGPPSAPREPWLVAQKRVLKQA